MECGTIKPVLPVKHDMAGVTEDLEIEPFIDDQDRGVTDDEDVEDQENMEVHGSDEAYRVAIAWANYGRYYYQGKAVAVGNILYIIRKKLPTEAEKYFIHWIGDNNYSTIQTQILELLRGNWIYKARAEQPPSIQKNYLLALSDSVEKE